VTLKYVTEYCGMVYSLGAQLSIFCPLSRINPAARLWIYGGHPWLSCERIQSTFCVTTYHAYEQT
jgi:hypothetical protein